jgi:hypothetical protein
MTSTRSVRKWSIFVQVQLLLHRTYETGDRVKPQQHVVIFAVLLDLVRKAI